MTSKVAVFLGVVLVFALAAAGTGGYAVVRLQALEEKVAALDTRASAAEARVQVLELSRDFLPTAEEIASDIKKEISGGRVPIPADAIETPLFCGGSVAAWPDLGIGGLTCFLGE